MPITQTWPLLPDPTPATPGQVTATEQAAQALGRGLPSFLGVGIVRPFRRDEKNDFATANGLALVASCVGQALGTRGDSALGPGELPWRTEFGGRFHQLRHRNQSEALDDLARVMAQEALERWEPRARAVKATIEKSLNPRLLVIRVRFDLIDRGGSVIAAGLETSIQLPSGVL